MKAKLTITKVIFSGEEEITETRPKRSMLVKMFCFWIFHMAAGRALFLVLPKGSTPEWALPYMGFYAYDTGFKDYLWRANCRTESNGNR